jgi:hypothetical protein
MQPAKDAGAYVRLHLEVICTSGDTLYVVVQKLKDLGGFLTWTPPQFCGSKSGKIIKRTFKLLLRFWSLQRHAEVCKPDQNGEI